ncbi:MAG TPA: phage tail protein [Stellaceae bacterium]|jgi:hypothetical protein|nr:phage tail protein [Stellaceae bacterium]
MTGILGGGAEAKKKNVAAALRFQASTPGGAIPLVYGANRLAINLLDYQNFNSNATGTGKGKGGGGSKAAGKGGGSQVIYAVDFIAGVCQGPIANWGLVWFNKTITTLLGGLTPYAQSIDEQPGADGQPSDSNWRVPATLLNYSGTAWFDAIQYQLGQSPALPNFNVEIYGLESGTAPNGYDANPAQIVIDLLTNDRYGAEFPAANLDTSGSLTDYANYCNAVGFMLAPVYDTQSAASNMLSEITAATNSAIVWSGGLLKIIPYGDQPLSSLWTPLTFLGELVQYDIVSVTISGWFGSVTITHQLTNNDIVSYAAAGAGVATAITGNGTLTDPGNGTLSANGIYASVTPAGLMIVQIQNTSQPVAISVNWNHVGGGSETLNVGSPAGPYAWTPNTTPIYSLGENDYIVQESSVGTYLGVTPGGPALRMGAGPITGGFTDDPVHITRSAPADAMNMVQLEVKNRGMSYATSVTEAFDQGSIDLYGIRRDTSVKANAIVDPYFVATIAAQIVLQRQLLYRNTYAFQLGWKYVLLEPMDLVQITDPYLGAQAITVQITSIEEDDEGTLSVTAEDWFGTPGAVMYPPPAPITTFGGVTMLGFGGGTATPYPKQSGASESSSPNYGQAAPSVNTPFILEPTEELLVAQGQTSPYIIIGLSGGPAATYNPNWGGAGVYVSLDGDTFGKFGEFVGRSTMGYTTADCPASGTSLPVDLAESNGSLNSVSAQLAANGASLCAVRTPAGLLEFLSYTTATLTGANQYALTGLYRGLYGTYAIDLPAGSQFLSLGSASFFYEVLPTQFVGQVLYFEFPGFNTVGGGAQTLSETTIYSYVPVGSSVIPGTFPVAVVKDHLAPCEIASGTTRRDSPLPIEDERYVVVTDQHQPIEQRRLVQQDDDNPLESS